MNSSYLDSLLQRVLPRVRRLGQDKFFRRVFTLAAGTAAGQLVSVAVTPVLTRLYSPDALGLYGTYAGLVATLAIFATWRYEQGIVVSRSASERHGLFYLTLVLSSIVGLITPPLAYAASGFMTPSTPMHTVLQQWSGLIGLSLALTGAVASARFLALKSDAFRELSGNQVLQTSAIAGVQIGLGLIFPDTVSLLVFGMAAGTAVVFLRMMWLAFRRRWADPRRYRFRWQRMVVAARRNDEYPRYMTLSSFLNTGSAQLPILLLGFFFVPAALGQFYLSLRVFRLPFSLISGSMAQANFKESSEAPPGKLKALYMSRVRYFIALGILPFGLLFLLAPALFAFVFGAEWREAGVLTQLSVPGIFVQFLFTAFTPMFTVLREQRLYLGWAVFRFVAVGVAMLPGAFLQDMRLATVGYSTALGVSFLLQHWLLLRLLKRLERA